MKIRQLYYPLMIITILFFIAFPPTFSANAAGNSFVLGDLRWDYPSIYNAQDYAVAIAGLGLPTTGADADFADGWLGVDLAQYDGTNLSAHFIQVGYEAHKWGIFWFIYAERGGLTYCRGYAPVGDSTHCYGYVNDIVHLGKYHWMEIKKNR